MARQYPTVTSNKVLHYILIGHVFSIHTVKTQSPYLLLVLPPRRVQGLDERGGVPHEHGEAGGAHDHAEDGEPHVGHAYGGVETVADAQHVAHGLEQGVGVLLPPCVVLRTERVRTGGGGSGEALLVFCANATFPTEQK